MNGGKNEQQYSGLLMDSKTYLDPVKTCGQLKKKEQEIDDPQDQYERYASNNHTASFWLFFNRYFPFGRAFTAVYIAVGLSHQFNRLIDRDLDLSTKNSLLRPFVPCKIPAGKF